jgi:hypothetical protein
MLRGYQSYLRTRNYYYILPRDLRLCLGFIEPKFWASKRLVFWLWWPSGLALCFLYDPLAQLQTKIVAFFIRGDLPVLLPRSRDNEEELITHVA